MTIALLKRTAKRKEKYRVENLAEFDGFPAAMVFAAEQEMLAVDPQGLPVIIGDVYQDGQFSRDGKPVTLPPDPTEKTIIQLSEENELLQNCILELADAVFGGGTI